jgi:hypothetical protein
VASSKNKNKNQTNKTMGALMNNVFFWGQFYDIAKVAMIQTKM